MFISSILLHVTNTQRLQSAFSVCLAKFGFNHYSMFAPDLMHEFELGVWKALFTHILRLLVALGNDSLQEFDSRYFLTLSNHCSLNNPINYFRFRFRKVPTLDVILSDVSVSMYPLRHGSQHEIMRICFRYIVLFYIFIGLILTSMLVYHSCHWWYLPQTRR